MSEDSKDNIQKQEAERREATEKNAQEQQAIVDAENLQEEEDLSLSNQAAAQAQQAEFAQEQADLAPASPTVPTWMREVVKVSFEYESVFGKLGEDERALALDGLKDILKFLEHTNVVKDFKETAQGFAAEVEKGGQVIFDLEANKVDVTSLSDNVFETMSSVVKAVGGNSLDINPLKDSEARFSAFKSASEKGLEVKGVEPQEAADFKNMMGITQKG